MNNNRTNVWFIYSGSLSKLLRNSIFKFTLIAKIIGLSSTKHSDTWRILRFSPHCLSDWIKYIAVELKKSKYSLCSHIICMYHAFGLFPESMSSD